MRASMMLLTFLIASPAEAENISDIIVLGEKRPAPLKETTTSAAIVTREMVEERGLRDVQDIYSQTANVSSANGPSGFSIRGISNFGVSGAGESPTSTVYLDGIPLPATFLQAAPTQLWNISQVEILRGPQSTLQGLNALAGAVILRSADPSLTDWESQGQIFLTSEAQQRIALSAGGPLIGDELSAGFSMETRNRKGNIWNLTRQVSEDRERGVTMRGKAIWQPRNWPGFMAKVSYIHADRDGPFYYVYARTDVPDFDRNRTAIDNIPNTTKLRFDGASLDIEYILENDLKLVSSGNWSNVRETSEYDGNYLANNTDFGHQERHYRIFTQEFRAVVNKPSVKGLFGLFVYDRELASKTLSRTAVQTPVATLAQFLRSGGFGATSAASIAQAYGNALPAIDVDFAGSFPTHIRAFAVFGDGRFAIARNISILLGFRAERETNESRTIQSSTFIGTFPNPRSFGGLAPVISQINGAVASLVAQANGAFPSRTRTFNAFLPKGGITVALSKETEVSFVVQKAYRSGGTSTNIARGEVFPYDPEYRWNYEAAIRSSLEGGRLRLNADAFYSDWHRQQVVVNFGLNNLDFHAVNAGRSHLYGFELEGSYRFQPSWTAYASVGHVRTKFDKFFTQSSTGASNLTGTEFAFAPDWTIVAGTDIRLKNGWGGNLNASHAGRSFGTVGVDQRNYRINPHSTFNARIGYKAEKWSLHMVASNIFNSNYIVYKNPAESRAVLSSPRSVGLEIAARY